MAPRPCGNTFSRFVKHQCLISLFLRSWLFREFWTGTIVVPDVVGPNPAGCEWCSAVLRKR